MIKWVRFCCCVVVISFAWLGLLPVALGQNALVENVEVCGIHHVSFKSLAKQVKTRPGQRYEAEQVKHDYEAVLAMGFFDPLKSKLLEETGPRGGKVITFDLSEYPDGKRHKK